MWFAFLLRFDGQLDAHQQAALANLLPLVIIVKLAVFARAKVGRVWHSFASLHDAARLLKATIAATAGVAAADLFVSPQSLLPRGVIVIDGCLTMLLISGFLALRRLHREHQERHHKALPSDARSVLIVGSAQSCETFLRAIHSRPATKHFPVGLVTDLPQMLHREIAGVPIVGIVETDNTASAAMRVGAETVMVISGDLPGHQVRRIMADCKEAEIPFQVIPEVSRIVDGHVNFQPREVAIEDLLGREPVKLQEDELHAWLDGQTILVTGSCGSIGSEIARQLLKYRPAKLVLMDRSETGQFFLERELIADGHGNRVKVVLADATDEKRVRQIFQEHNPAIVFHAAAYKHVPLMEANPQEAVKNIVQATRILADAAHRHDCESFVMISTDKAVNPTNVMGCCKRVAELYVQATSRHSDTRFVTVRFGNVLGSNGSVIPIFREQIAAGGPLTVTHPDMTRYFMTIPEASQLVIEAGRMGDGGEIFVLDMGQPVKIIELARDMIKLSGLSEGEDIEVELTGLRPGEKMYEELYTDDEQRQATTHPKILVAESVTINRVEISHQITRLISVSLLNENLIREELKKIVPLYTPQSAAPSVSISPARAA